MCVYVYVYVYVRVNVHVHVHVLCMCMNECVYICVCIPMYMYVHTYTYMYIWIRTYIHPCIHTDRQAGRQADIYTYVYSHAKSCICRHLFTRMCHVPGKESCPDRLLLCAVLTVTHLCVCACIGTRELKHVISCVPYVHLLEHAKQSQRQKLHCRGLGREA